MNILKYGCFYVYMHIEQERELIFVPRPTGRAAKELNASYYFMERLI